MQDTLYRAAALTDSSGNVVEAYDCDAYGNTITFTAADSSGNWQVVQRYVYSPYGTITVLNADWSTTPTGTQPVVDNLYQGMTLDQITGLYDERFRNYSPSLGRWINQDPAGYINGANTYQFVGSAPAANVDPRGLRSSAFGQYVYWRARTQDLVALFSNSHFQGSDLALLKGIAAAAMLKELQAERHFASGHHGEDPIQYLNHLLNRLHRAEHSLKCHPGDNAALKRIEKALDDADRIASAIRDGLALNSGSGPQQIAAMGNILSQLGSHLPPGFKQIVGFYGDALSAAANAVGQLYKAEGTKGWNYLNINNIIPPSSDGGIPFSPGWAHDILNQAGLTVPGFAGAYRSYSATSDLHL